MAKKVNENSEQVLENSDPETLNVARTEDAVHEQEAKKHTRPKGKILVSGAEYYDFEKDGNPFVGFYSGREAKREKDEVNGPGKAGDIIGYFFSTEDGGETIIGNSYSIKKALSDPDVKPGSKISIQFLGKGETAGGKPVNRFEVILMD